FLLQSIGIDFADNYYKTKLNVKKISRHNCVTDAVLASTIAPEVWAEQARFIKEILTADVLENIFNELPTSGNQELLKASEFRLENLEIMAEDYGNFLQKTVVVFGSHQDDIFVIHQTSLYPEVQLKS